MEVRRAGPEDAGAIAAGMSSVSDEGRWLATESTTSEAELRARFEDALGDWRHALWVLEEGGEVLGSVGLHPTQAKGVLSVGMWVLERCRGRGGGRMLLAAALDFAAGGDAHKIELEVFPDNGRAIALYAGAGFEVEGLRRRHYRRSDGALRSALIMALHFER